MRYATKVTCDAHKSVMTKCKPGMMEYQCEANFLHYAYFVGGCRHVGYNNICCSGMNGAILHYGHATEPNSKQINDGDMWLEQIFLSNNNIIKFISLGSYYACLLCINYYADILCSNPSIKLLTLGSGSCDYKILCVIINNLKFIFTVGIINEKITFIHRNQIDEKILNLEKML